MKLYQLKNCESALAKLYRYDLLDPGVAFSLMATQNDVVNTLESRNRTFNSILKKHGTSEDSKHYDIPIENKEALLKDLEILDNQEVNITFPPDKITLCVESISRAEEGLPADKRLGFNAHDWAAIQEVIKVIETEG